MEIYHTVNRHLGHLSHIDHLGNLGHLSHIGHLGHPGHPGHPGHQDIRTYRSVSQKVKCANLPMHEVRGLVTQKITLLSKFSLLLLSRLYMKQFGLTSLGGEAPLCSHSEV